MLNARRIVLAFAVCIAGNDRAEEGATQVRAVGGAVKSNTLWYGACEYYPYRFMPVLLSAVLLHNYSLY